MIVWFGIVAVFYALHVLKQVSIKIWICDWIIPDI